MNRFKLNKLFRGLEPEEQLTIEIRNYKDDRWEFRFLVKEPERLSARLAGAVVLRYRWAYILWLALITIDISQNVKIEGRVKTDER